MLLLLCAVCLNGFFCLVSSTPTLRCRIFENTRIDFWIFKWVPKKGQKRYKNSRELRGAGIWILGSGPHMARYVTITGIQADIIVQTSKFCSTMAYVSFTLMGIQSVQSLGESETTTKTLVQLRSHYNIYCNYSSATVVSLDFVLQFFSTGLVIIFVALEVF